MSTHSCLTIAAVTLMLTGLVACERRSNADNTERGTTKDAGLSAKKTAAAPTTSTVSVEADRTTTQPARIEAFETTPLYAKISGYVKTVHRDIGDRITEVKRQPLVTLFVPEMKDEEKQKLALELQAKAQVAQSKAAVTLAKAKLQSAKAQVEEASAGLVRTEGSYKRWQAELLRIKGLAKDGSIARKIVDETQYEFDSADAARKETLAKIRSAKASEREADAAVEQAEAESRTAAAKLKVAEANRGYTQTMLKYLVIHSPFPGVITERNIDTGHFVRPGDSEKSRPLFVIARTDTLRVFVDVPEREAPFISRGNKAVIRVPALGKQGTFTAAVTRTSYVLNPRNRTLRVEIDTSNRKGLLRPGMYAIATITLSREPVPQKP